MRLRQWLMITIGYHQSWRVTKVNFMVMHNRLDTIIFRFQKATLVDNRTAALGRIPLFWLINMTSG